ncbi:MAG: hypothetical protein M0P14_00780 [Alkaliphilus sp.]|nr:hypothetical protein [Alkaliphilus sp.]
MKHLKVLVATVVVTMTIGFASCANYHNKNIDGVAKIEEIRDHELADLENAAEFNRMRDHEMGDLDFGRETK